MIKVDVKIKINPENKKEVAAAIEERINKTAGYILKVARNSIKETVKRPSAPGRPPNTRRKGNLLKNSLHYAYERRGHVHTVYVKSRIGIDYGRNPKEYESTGGGAAEVARVHEFGGIYRGKRYPKRPFLAPALTKSLPAIPGIWSRSRSGSGAKQQ